MQLSIVTGTWGMGLMPGGAVIQLCRTATAQRPPQRDPQREAHHGARGWQARGAAAIPQFFFPGGRPVPEEVLAAAAARVDALLAVYSGGLTVPGMKQLVKEVCL